MSKPTIPSHSGSPGRHRGFRAVALGSMLVGGLTFLTAGIVQAELAGETPVDETPVDETPVDETPVDETPVDETPVDEEPVDEEPVDEEPVASDAPSIQSIIARPGALTVAFLPAEGSTPLYYLVQAKVGDVVKATQVVLGDARSVSLSGLQNGVEHDVFVVAISLFSFTDVSEVVKATPLANGAAVIAPLAVHDVQVQRTNYSATVTWNAPGTDGGSPIQHFVVNAVDTSTGKLVMWRTVPADVRSASIAPIVKGVAYDINVFAVSGTAFGAVTTVGDVVGSSALADPLAPSLPWAKAYVDGDVVASWAAPLERGVPVLGYNAVVIQDGKMVAWGLAGATARSLEVTGFDKTKAASVYVFSSSAIGYGPMVKIDLAAPAA